jgi:polyisoprenoid-binding protein YceI
VEGDLTIHGVTKPVSEPGKITVNGDGSVKAVSEFIVKPEEYAIKIPGVVRKNIAEEITVKVDMDYKKM